MHGRLVKTDGTPVTTSLLVYNPICYLFEVSRYTIHSIKIDRNKMVGLTSLMKTYTSFHPAQSHYVENTGWLEGNIYEKSLTNAAGYFYVSISLSIIFGFS